MNYIDRGDVCAGENRIAKNQEMIVVLDFGSQYNQLITRRIREFGVYSELHPHTITVEEIEKMNPTGIIFSGPEQCL